MSLFDSLIGEVTGRFGLGAKSGTLLTALLKYMTSESTGGIGGFLENFTKSGIGDLASSWVSRGDNSPISVDQLTGALGDNAISGLAQEAGVGAEQAKPALAYMIPKVVDLLTPSGTVPTSLPDTVMSFVKGGAGAALGAAASAVGAGASAVGAGADALRGGVGAAANLAGDAAAGGSSMLFKLLPLLALALLAFLGYQYCAGQPTDTANVNKPAVATTTPMPAKAMVDSSLNIVVKDGKYVISGVVPDQKTKDDIIAKATAAYGAGNFDVAGLKIDANAKAPEWLAKLGDAFGALKGAGNGAVLSFTGAAVKLEGLAGAAAQGLLDKLKGFFPSISLAGAIDEGMAAKDAEMKAEEALKKLGDNFTAAQLAEALNLEIINFPSGGAGIPKDREKLLTDNAAYIKKLPAGSHLEVGGHTDNTGNAAGNTALSGKRADAVKAFLEKAGVAAGVLTAKGYGPDKPKASNDTAAGKFANRRIEFTGK